MRFGVSIAGCPYLFGAPGLLATDTITSSDPAWSSAWVVAEEALGWEGNEIPSWSEECSPIDGTLTVGQLTFTLHDVPATNGPASGAASLLTYLTTRLPRTIIKAPLAASIDADDMSLSVVSGFGSSFPSGAQTLWIGREAIRCSGRSSDTFTVTTRGYYGSRALAHTVNGSTATAPVAWAEFPWVTKRRVGLWVFDDAGVGTLLWRGVCNRSPRGPKGSPSIQLQCESLTTLLDEARLAPPGATCRVAGFHQSAMFADAIINEDFFSAGESDLTDPALIRPTLASALSELGTKLTAAIAPTWPGGVQVDISAEGRGARASLTGDGGSGVESVAIGLHVGDKSADATSTETTGTRTAVARIDDAPQVWFCAWVQYITPIGVDNLAGLPTTWTATQETHDGVNVWAEVILRGEYDDGNYLEIRPVSSGVASVPYLNASARLVPKGTTTPPHPVPGVAISKATKLVPTTHVQAGHWLTGLRYGLVADLAGTLAGQIDPDDWDWSQAARCEQLTAGAIHARDWYLDGSATFSSVLADTLKLTGCGLGIRDGRLSPFAFQPPTESDVPTVELIDEADEQLDEPEWASMPDSLVNVVRINGELVKQTVPYGKSVGEYGESRTVEVTLEGVQGEGVLAASPQELANGVLSRLLGLWSEPVNTVTVVVTLDALFTTPVAIGDYVLLSAYTAPDGTGSRGLEEQAVQVYGREIDLGAGEVKLKCLNYSRPGLAGWAPALRIASIAGAVLTVDTGYISASATDYAGSNLDGYPFTANDGGLGYWAATYKGLLRRINTTTATTLAVTVLSIGAGTLTITAAPGATWEGYATDGELDLVFDDYGTVIAAQRVYGFVSDEDDLLIGASSDATQLWSP